MSVLGSVRGRAIVAGVVLVLLLAAMASVGVWRGQTVGEARASVEHKAMAAAHLGRARGQFFLTSSLLAASVFSEDATSFLDMYGQARLRADEAVAEARGELAAIGDVEGLAELDAVSGQMDGLFEEMSGIMAIMTASGGEARLAVAQQYQPQMWPKSAVLIADLEHLTSHQEATLAAEQAAADRVADISLALLIALCTGAFVIGALALTSLMLSVVRPLARLRGSVGAIASGDLEARAEVSGPEEVASLAGDFNAMIAKRKRAEEALRESEERYRDLFESANDLIQSVRPDGSFAYVNRAWREALGYSEENVRRLSIFDIIHPDSRQHCQEMFRRVMNGEDIVGLEALFVAKDGRTIAVEGSSSCSFKDGRPVATRGIFRDITERKRAEEALRTQHDLGLALSGATSREETLDLAYQRGLSDGFVDSASHYAADSPNARAVMAGEPIYTQHDALRRALGDAEHPEGLRAIAVVPVRHEGEVIACLNVASHTLDDIPVPSRHALEAIAAQIGSVIARTRVQEALQESEERFRRLASVGSEGIVIHDTVRVLDVNAAAPAMFGYEASEAIGMPLPDFIALECHDMLSERMVAEVPEAFELVGRRKDGSTFPIEIYGSAFPGGPRGSGGAGHHRTQARRGGAARERREVPPYLRERAGRLLPDRSERHHRGDEPLNREVWIPPRGSDRDPR